MSDRDQTKSTRRAQVRDGMTSLSAILPRVMAGIIARACATGHPPPSFTTGGYDHPDDAPSPEPSPPTTR